MDPRETKASGLLDADGYHTDEDEELAAIVLAGTVAVVNDRLLIQHFQPEGTSNFFGRCMQLLEHLSEGGVVSDDAVARFRELCHTASPCDSLSEIIGEQFKLLRPYSHRCDLRVGEIVSSQTGHLVPNIEVRVRRNVKVRWPECVSPVPFLP